MKSLFCMILLGLITFSGTGLAAPEGVKTLEPGAKAPTFQLKGVDGKMHSLEEYADAKVLAVVFTCNHCPTAQAYEGRIKKLAADYKEQGVQLVAISPNDPKSVRLNELGYTDLSDSYEEMKIRAEAEDFNFPYLYDGDQQNAAKAYGPVATPHVFVFDTDRKLRYVGRIDDSENPVNITSHDARNAIEAILAGKEVPVKKTAVFGCSVKWAGKEEQVQAYMERLSKEKVSVKDINVEGMKELLANGTDKYRLVNFWATWCGPCVAEFPDLVEISRMYRHRGVDLVTVSADKPHLREKVLEFLKRHEASGANYHFTGENVYDLIEAVGHDWAGAIPFTLLLAPGGEVVFEHLGQVDPLELKRAIVGQIGRTYF